MKDDTVCIITTFKEDIVHTVVKNRLQAKRYCKKHPQFMWECYSINNVTIKGELK